MNNRKFKRRNRMTLPNFRIPKTTMLALFFWAHRARPERYPELVKGDSLAEIRRCLDHFNEKPEHAKVVATARFGCDFRSDVDEREIVKAAMQADYEKTVLS